MSGKRKTSALVFTLAVFAYTLASAILLVHSEQLNGHRFIYPLDDSYIHLSIARNMALHGSFGINAGEYAAATSAPLWTLMLSAVLRIAGIRETSALAMSFCSGLLLLLVCFLLLRRLEAGMTVQILAYGLIVFATPMPLLGLSGMEHLLHAAVVILIVFGAGSVLASEAPPLIGIAPLLALIAAGVLVRFETLFVAAIFAGFLLLGKRWLISFLVAMAAAIPVLLTGAISVSHGWFWMPASILIKSQKAPVTGLSTLFSRLGGHAANALYETPHLLILFLVMSSLLLYRTWPGFRTESAIDWMLAISLCTFLFHLQFAATGWLMRYEAYLVALGTLVIAAAVNESVRNLLPVGYAASLQVCAPRQLLAAAVALLILLLPLAQRAAVGLTFFGAASHNIFQQQFQMAAFLHNNYDGASVAANDIGAITFFTHVDCLDLFGLANRTVAAARLNRNYTTSVIATEAERRGARIAVVYDNWFDGTNLPHLPAFWAAVEKWTVDRNVILGGSTVTFYATHLADADDLSRRLRAFDRGLPRDVGVSRP